VAFGFEVAAFEVFVIDKCSFIVHGRPRENASALTRTACDREDQASWGAPIPPRDVYVSRAAGRFSGYTILGQRTHEGPGQKEVWLLQLRVEGSAASYMQALVAEEVVPLGPVAASRADKAVVAPYIHSTVAETAEVLGLKYGHAYPSLDHGLVVEGIDIPVKCLGRDRVEPLTSAAGGGEVDVRLASEISTINERLPGVFVQAGGQGFL